MIKKIFYLLFIVLVIGSAFFYKNQKNSKVETARKKVHYHAGFLVYVDGKLQDFSDSKYMLISPCSQKESEVPPQRDPASGGKNEPANEAGEQLEKAHLHDNIGDVVHVEAPGATWKDLFKNIDFSFEPKNKLTTYLNGGKTDDLLSQPIVPDDSVIFISGDEKGIDIEKYVTKEHIEEVAKKSETCGT